MGSSVAQFKPFKVLRLLAMSSEEACPHPGWRGEMAEVCALAAGRGLSLPLLFLIIGHLFVFLVMDRT